VPDGAERTRGNRHHPNRSDHGCRQVQGRRLDSGPAGAVASPPDARGPPPLSKNPTRSFGAWQSEPREFARIHRDMPIVDWSSIGKNALRFAMTMSREIEVLHIESQDSSDSLKQIWPSCVEEPAREANQGVPRLTVFKSPFRFVVRPIVDHVLEIERKNLDRTIAVLLPQLVEPRWYQYFLQNQRARLLTADLLRKGTHRIVIVNVPWYLRKRR
jgi:hypothetical protein